MDENDLGGRHKLLIDLFEGLSKMLCVIALKEALANVPDFKEQLPQKEKSLDFLKHPSLGGFVSLLRELTKINADKATTQPIWVLEIAKWYLARSTSSNRRALRLLGDIENLRFNKNSKTPHAEIFNALATYRNKHHSHAASFTPAELSHRLKILELVIAYLLDDMEFLERINVFYVEEVKRISDSKEEVKLTNLIGLNPGPPQKITTSRKLELSSIYIDKQGQQELKHAINLTPFLIWQPNRQTSQPEIYYFNDAKRTNLEYISYSSGSYYHHKELHDAFKQIIDFEIKPDEGFEILKLSEQERNRKYDQFYKQAMVSIDRGELENGAEFLEIAIDYKREIDALMELAKTQYALRDPVDAVIKTIEGALEISPNCQDALELLKQVNSGDSLELKDKELLLTPFHLLCPKRYSDIWPLASLGTIVIYYSISVAFGKAFLSEEHDALFIALGYLAIIAWTVGYYLALKYLERIYFLLAAQLDSVRLDRFKEWYSKALIRATGECEFIYDRSRFSLKKFLRAELFYVLLFAVAVFGLTLSSVQVQQEPMLAVKRMFDLVPWAFVAVACIKFTLGIVFFVFEYSRFPIKPMLTVINDSGLRSLGTLFCIVIVSELTGVTLSVWYSSSAFTGSEVIGSVLIGILYVMVSAFTIGMPYVVYFASKNAKSKVTLRYAEKLEDSFNRFIEDPGKETLEKYSWLKKQQKVIQNISSWPLNWKQTLFVVVGGNLVLGVVCVRFILMQFDKWESLTSALHSAIGL